ncbi:MAG: glycosyltransferase [Pseudomonadota bacterium]
MKIHIYTDIDNLFGKACRIWMGVLLAAGHEVEYVDLGTEKQGVLPDVGPADINLLVVGIYAFERFGKHGLPRGKNVLWMLDPLTRNPQATVHGYKAGLFDAFAPRLDAVLAMDQPIEDYLRLHYPSLAVSQLPYLIADIHIRAPGPESARTSDVLFIGHPSPPREEAEALFRASGVKAEFVWAGLWGKAREERLRHARIALTIHADPQHTYFDQFRTLEAWAAGTVVVSQTSDGLAPHGITPGEHLATGALAELPSLCQSLLNDADRRQAMAVAAQALLRKQFSVQRWQAHMLAAIASVS